MYKGPLAAQLFPSVDAVREGFDRPIFAAHALGLRGVLKRPLLAYQGKMLSRKAITTPDLST
jgi:hypothetical protein